MGRERESRMKRQQQRKSRRKHFFYSSHAKLTNNRECRSRLRQSRFYTHQHWYVLIIFFSYFFFFFFLFFLIWNIEWTASLCGGRWTHWLLSELLLFCVLICFHYYYYYSVVERYTLLGNANKIDESSWWWWSFRCSFILQRFTAAKFIKFSLQFQLVFILYGCTEMIKKTCPQIRKFRCQ